MDLHLQYPATPENAAQIADLMVEPAQRISKVNLDYSIASLKHVDRIVRRMWREVGRVGRATETLFGFGCYIGEVIVRNHGGQWRATKETSLRDTTRMPLVIELEPGTFCDPIGQVFERFKSGKEESLLRFYHTLTGTRMEEKEGRLPGFLDWLLGRR
jgi:hypothetical protein